MSIKYADRPQLNYGSPSRTDEIIRKIPRGANTRMDQAPQNTSIAVMGDDGKSYWAMSHRDRFEKLRPDKDRFSGAVTWRMCGESIMNPLAWWIPQRQR